MTLTIAPRENEIMTMKLNYEGILPVSGDTELIQMTCVFVYTCINWCQSGVDQGIFLGKNQSKVQSRISTQMQGRFT